MKKQTPILFSTSMVESIIDLLKTNTRRNKGLEEINKNPDEWKFVSYMQNHACFVHKNKQIISIPFQFGEEGDFLWVRETHKLRSIKDYKNRGVKVQAMYKTPGIKNVYPKQLSSTTLEKIKNIDPQKWRPSIFLFKEFSRIWLKVVSVRVERLQSITEQDAIKEGVQVIQNDASGILYKNYLGERLGERSAIDSFASLWKSINGIASWDQNPWVWAIQFKQTKKPI